MGKFDPSIPMAPAELGFLVGLAFVLGMAAGWSSCFLEMAT